MLQLKKKVLITGHRGMLGSCFNSESLPDWELSYFCEDTTIENRESIDRQISNIRPDFLVHTAAYTDVDGCQINPSKAFSVNVQGTKNIAQICKKYDVKMVYFSSTGVYGDNKSDAYIESDHCTPSTVHHRSKLTGEMEVMSILNDYIILRVGWLYGGQKSHKNNFVFNRIREAEGTELMFASEGQVGNPTSCVEVVQQTKLLLDRDIVGLYNCVNSAEGITRYDYVKEIVSLANPGKPVKKANSNMFVRRAPVSFNESAINERLIASNLNIMSDWRKALQTYIATY